MRWDIRNELYMNFYTTHDLRPAEIEVEDTGDMKVMNNESMLEELPPRRSTVNLGALSNLAALGDLPAASSAGDEEAQLQE